MAIQAPESEPRTPTRRRSRVRWWTRHGEPIRYGLAFLMYVALGLFAEQMFASWIIGVGFLVAAVWGIPAIWRRFR